MRLTDGGGTYYIILVSLNIFKVLRHLYYVSLATVSIGFQCGGGDEL